MPNKLTSYLVGEVSLVDRGANLKPRFSVTKEKDMDPVQAVLQTKAEGEDKFLAALKAQGLEQKAIDAAVAHYRLSTGFKDILKTEVTIEALKAAGIELPTADPVKPADPAKPEPTDKDLENLPEAVKKKLEAMDAVQKQYETMVETLKTERNTNRKAEFVRKAKDEFTHVPGNTEDIGQTLYDAYEVSDEFGKKIEKQLMDTQAALKSSALLTRAGVGGDG
ncbi:hypothetical protein LCGC14_2081050, partial [marine sediment metagenome]